SASASRKPAPGSNGVISKAPLPAGGNAADHRTSIGRLFTGRPHVNAEPDAPPSPRWQAYRIINIYRALIRQSAALLRGQHRDDHRDDTEKGKNDELVPDLARPSRIV